MNIHLESFLQDLAQGVYGETSINYSQIANFSKNATQFQLGQLQGMFWLMTSEAGDNEDFCEIIAEIEELLDSVE